MRLTPDFHDWEISVSTSHPDLAVPFEDLAPYLVANAMRVLEGFAQPARDVAGKIGVLSFIRSQALNDATPGASPTSSHLTGLGLDFRPLVISPAQFWEMAQPGGGPNSTRTLEAAGCEWDKLNMYTTFELWSFHVGLRPLEEGPGRRRLFVDWQEVTP